MNTTTLTGNGIHFTAHAKGHPDSELQLSLNDRATWCAIIRAYLDLLGEGSEDCIAWGSSDTTGTLELAPRIFQRSFRCSFTLMRKGTDSVWRQDPSTSREFALTFVNDYN